MLQVNPGIVTDNLIGYFDLNNNRCYTWDGSLLCKNLVNGNERLSSFYDTIFTTDKNKRYLNLSESNKIGGAFSARQLQNFTLQFWLKINSDFNFENSINRLVSTQGLSSIAEVEPITFGNEELTYDGEPITILVFNESSTIEDSESITLFLNNTGGLGIYDSSLYPNYVNSKNISFSGKDIDEWHLITCVRNISTITFYKDLYGEIYIYQDTTFPSKTVKIDGFQTFLNNFSLNHILIYDRALTKKEIFKNYSSFYPTYVDKSDHYNNTAPYQINQPEASFLLPRPF